MRIRHFIICGLSGSTIFVHIISQKHDFTVRFGVFQEFSFVWILLEVL